MIGNLIWNWFWTLGPPALLVAGAIGMRLLGFHVKWVIIALVAAALYLYGGVLYQRGVSAGSAYTQTKWDAAVKTEQTRQAIEAHEAWAFSERQRQEREKADAIADQKEKDHEDQVKKQPADSRGIDSADDVKRLYDIIGE